MEQVSIPKISVEARLVNGEVEVAPINVRVKPETTADEGDVTPLNMLASGLAACEALMFSMIASKMGVTPQRLSVAVEAEFRIGYGMTRARIEYRIAGMSIDTAERIAGMVKEYCPVYRTLERAGVELEDEVTVEA